MTCCPVVRSWAEHLPSTSPLGGPMPEGEHPAEGAENGAAAPAVRGTTAFDGAHAFDEPTDDREEHVQAQCTSDQALHDANVRRPNDSGQRALPRALRALE